MEKLKACGYVRVSTAMQAEEGESLATQRKQIEDFVKQKDWILTKIYADEGATATKVEYRVQFQQMIADAKAGHFKVIIFYKLSRFARNARDYQNYVFELKKYGVDLISIKENIDPSTPTGKMIAGMLALFAEWEHEAIREQMAENKTVRWQEKRIFLGTSPFGYKWNKATKKLEINQEEANIYLEMVKLCAKQNMTLRDIAISLNNRGLVPDRVLIDGTIKKKAPWSPVTVSHILKNPCYYGHYVLNKTVYEDGQRGAGTKHTKNLKPASENISFPIDALITKQEWDKIQDTIKFHIRIPKHINDTTLNSYLRSALVCGRCGAKMEVKQGNKRKDGSVYRYYCCHYTTLGKKDLQLKNRKCDLPYINADMVEDEVWGNFRLLFRIDTQESRNALNKLVDPTLYDEDIAKLNEASLHLENELMRCERKRKKLWSLLEEPDKFNSDEVSLKLRENDVEKLTIQGNMKKIADELEEKKKLKEDSERFAIFFNEKGNIYKTFEDEISKLSLSDRKLLIESMLNKPIIVNWVPDDHSYIDPLTPILRRADGKGGKQTPGLQIHSSFRINSDILNRFIEEGKIEGLNKDSSECSY